MVVGKNEKKRKEGTPDLEGKKRTPKNEIKNKRYNTQMGVTK